MTNNIDELDKIFLRMTNRILTQIIQLLKQNSMMHQLMNILRKKMIHQIVTILVIYIYM